MQVREIAPNGIHLTGTTWTVDDDITVMVRSDDGVSCYTCGDTDLSKGLFASGGAAICYGCARKYETRKDIPATVIPTDRQRATEQCWRDAGIGTN